MGNFVPAAFINNAEHWRKRAEEVRTLADDMKDEKSKEAMLKVQLIVGDWRVTGMRGEEKRNGWTEKALWSFKIEKDVYAIRLAATDPHAHGTLAIETDHPTVPHWQTRVEFSPR